MSECSICYEEGSKCRLICGHVFHHSCIKQWYMNSEHTQCPLCRSKLWFRGFRPAKWEDEKYDKLNEDVYNDVVNEAMKEGFDDIFLYILEDIQKLYNKYKEYTDPDTLRYILTTGDEPPNEHVVIYTKPLNFNVPKKNKRQNRKVKYNKRR